MAFENYGGCCTGRLMAFLYEYTTNSDYWQFGEKEIISNKKVIGTYSFKDITDIPEFNFTDPKYIWINEVHERTCQERARYIERFKKQPAPYFGTDFRTQKKFTDYKNIQMNMGLPWAEAFAEIYKGDLDRISPEDYEPISKELEARCKLILEAA